MTRPNDTRTARALLPALLLFSLCVATLFTTGLAMAWDAPPAAVAPLGGG